MTSQIMNIDKYNHQQHSCASRGPYAEINWEFTKFIDCMRENYQCFPNRNIIFYTNIAYFSENYENSSLTEGNPSGISGSHDHPLRFRGIPATFSTVEYTNIGACFKYIGVESGRE